MSAERTEQYRGRSAARQSEPPRVSILAALTPLLALDRLPRSGWLLAGVPAPESVAAHSLGTALVVLATRAWETGADAAVLSARAFSIGLPGQWGHLTVSISLITFAFSTIIGWSFYGETAVTYLFGARAEIPYRLLWIAFVYLGATGSLQIVWGIADTLNGLMAIPNLIAVLGSLGLLLRMIREFFHER